MFKLYCSILQNYEIQPCNRLQITNVTYYRKLLSVFRRFRICSALYNCRISVRRESKCVVLRRISHQNNRAVCIPYLRAFIGYTVAQRSENSVAAGNVNALRREDHHLFLILVVLRRIFPVILPVYAGDAPGAVYPVGYVVDLCGLRIFAAFEYGIGDIVTLWAPLTYVGEKRGWKVASTPHDCYRGLPIVIVADREFADKNPEATAKFLSIYMRAIDMMKNEPMDKLLPEYLRFYVDWAGTDYSKDLAEMDLKNHPVFNLEEQLQMFDASEGPSQAQSWQGDLAQFFAAIGRISQDELKKVENSSYVTDKFLKLIKTPLPSYK